MSESNKQLARKSFEEPWNQGNFESITELYADDLTAHGLGVDVPPGVEGLKQFITIYRTAFPDVQFTIDDQIAETDKVATRWTATGTHKGPMLGVEPTGDQVTVTGMVIDRIDNGKIVETWYNFDALGQLRQMGIVPSTAHQHEESDHQDNTPRANSPQRANNQPHDDAPQGDHAQQNEDMQQSDTTRMRGYG